jgi:hypothetical protein
VLGSAMLVVDVERVEMNSEALGTSLPQMQCSKRRYRTTPTISKVETLLESNEKKELGVGI